VIQYVMGSALDAEGRFNAARRIFGGGLVAISGLVTFAALAGLLVTFWEKVPDFDRAQENHVDRIKAFGSWFVCFGAVYFAAATRMARGAAAVRPA
jgi:hypothetical protein